MCFLSWNSGIVLAILLSLPRQSSFQPLIQLCSIQDPYFQEFPAFYLSFENLCRRTVLTVSYSKSNVANNPNSDIFSQFSFQYQFPKYFSQPIQCHLKLRQIQHIFVEILPNEVSRSLKSASKSVLWTNFPTSPDFYIPCNSPLKVGLYS